MLKSFIAVIFLSTQIFASREGITVSRYEFIIHHKQLVKVLIEQEKNTKYPKSLIPEGQFSSSLFDISLLINDAFANNRMCFFGGWPSYSENGSCKTPWKYQNDSELKSLGPTYNSDHYCGSKTLYRCNPTLFGDAPSGKGLCIELSSYGNYTKKCFETTRDRTEDIYEKYKNDESYRRNYQAQANSIKEFCIGNNGFGACQYLLGQLSDIQNKICDEQRIRTLDNRTEGILSSLLNFISPSASRSVAQEDQQEEEEEQVEGLARSLRPIARPERPEREPSSICEHYNKFRNTGVPEKALKQALSFYQSNESRFPRGWISIADYTDNSRNERFYMFNVETGEVRTHDVSHGSGHQNGVRRGDSNHDGELDRCSHNGNRTNMTRPGFFRVSEPYYSSSHPTSWPSIGSGKNGVRMDGLSGSLNDHARNRGVVMHGADYNSGAVMGRSYGCPAFRPGEAREILNTIMNGSLFYSYVGENCSSDQAAVDRSVSNWEQTCE